MDDPPPPFLPHTSLRELAAQVDPRYELDDEVADGQRAPWPGEGAGGVAAGWGTGTALRGYQRWQPNVCLVFNVLCSQRVSLSKEVHEPLCCRALWEGGAWSSG